MMAKRKKAFFFVVRITYRDALSFSRIHSHARTDNDILFGVVVFCRDEFVSLRDDMMAISYPTYSSVKIFIDLVSRIYSTNSVKIKESERKKRERVRACRRNRCNANDTQLSTTTSIQEGLPA